MNENNEAYDYSAIISLYKNTQREIDRYRDMEWKICYWTVILMTGTIAAFKYTLDILSQDIINRYQTFIIVGFNTFVFVAAAYGCWHIHFVHESLTENRKLRRKLEKLLNLSNLLPKKWMEKEVRYFKGIKHLLTWWSLIVVSALFALILINVKFDFDSRNFFLSILVICILYFFWKFISNIIER
jgi:hypothetical protein